MHYVLIIAVLSGTPQGYVNNQNSTFSREFPGKEECEAAKKQIADQLKTDDPLFVVCVPKR